MLLKKKLKTSMCKLHKLKLYNIELYSLFRQDSTHVTYLKVLLYEDLPAKIDYCPQGYKKLTSCMTKLN